MGTCAVIPSSFANDMSLGTRKVITAAHKLEAVGANDLLKVRVGEYDARGFNPPETVRHQEFTVVRYSVYPKYKGGRFLNDIAILHLEKDINLFSSNGVNAACLPPCLDMFGTGTTCWVAGWGKDRKGGQFQPIMKKVDVPLYDRGQCSNTIRNALIDRRSRNADRFRLHDSEICAGGVKGKDACDGDGGAPLVCQSREGNW